MVSAFTMRVQRLTVMHGVEARAHLARWVLTATRSATGTMAALPRRARARRSAAYKANCMLKALLPLTRVVEFFEKVGVVQVRCLSETLVLSGKLVVGC